MTDHVKFHISKHHQFNGQPGLTTRDAIGHTSTTSKEATGSIHFQRSRFRKLLREFVSASYNPRPRPERHYGIRISRSNVLTQHDRKDRRNNHLHRPNPPNLPSRSRFRRLTSGPPPRTRDAQRRKRHLRLPSHRPPLRRLLSLQHNEHFQLLPSAAPPPLTFSATGAFELCLMWFVLKVFNLSSLQVNHASRPTDLSL